MRDIYNQTHWIAHAVDAATRFHFAKVLSTKSSQEVGNFMAEQWFTQLGVPSAVTCDMGPEFVSDQFQELMDRHNVHLLHVAVEASWQNGLAERVGGTLKFGPEDHPSHLHG